MFAENKRAGVDNASAAAQGGKKKDKPTGKRAWKMMDRAATVAAGLVAHRLTALAWRAATGKKPPASSQHPELGKLEAVTWAVFAGAGAELAKVLIHRATADYWVKSTGRLPPGMKPLAGKKKPAGPPEGAPAGSTTIRSRSRDK